MFMLNSVRHVNHQFKISYKRNLVYFEDVSKARANGIPIHVILRVVIPCLMSANIFVHVLSHSCIFESFKLLYWLLIMRASMCKVTTLFMTISQHYKLIKIAATWWGVNEPHNRGLHMELKCVSNTLQCEIFSLYIYYIYYEWHQLNTKKTCSKLSIFLLE